MGLHMILFFTWDQLNLKRILIACWTLKKIVHEKYDQCPLVLAGAKGPMFYDLDKNIKDRKLETTVKMIGYIDENDVVPLLSAAKFLFILHFMKALVSLH